MALSVINYTYLHLDDATVPFLVADCVLVLIVLTLTQKSIKAEMEIEQRAAADKANAHEQQKAYDIARKISDRDKKSKNFHEARHEKHLNVRTHETKPMGKQYMGANKKGH